jgi:hypothetical protein
MPKINISNDYLGKAYKAFEAYNWKQKKDRLHTFDLKRWLKVVQAIEADTTRARVTAKLEAFARNGRGKGHVRHP